MNFMHWKEVFIKSLTELIMSDTSIGHTRLLETLWGQKTRKVRNRTFFPKGEKSSSQLNLNKGTLLLFCFVKMNEDRCLVQHLSRCTAVAGDPSSGAKYEQSSVAVLLVWDLENTGAWSSRARTQNTDTSSYLDIQLLKSSLILFMYCIPRGGNFCMFACVIGSKLWKGFIVYCFLHFTEVSD